MITPPPLSPQPLQKVLIVDDAADNRQMLNDLLKADYTVLLAKSGEQGLERATQHRPDLILLDVLMPGMSGYEVMARLQQDPRVSDIAVIFITGLDSPEDIAKGLMHGAADYISKPFNADIVRARVAAQMRLARQQRLVMDDLARTDTLTGLPNRLAFDTALADELKRGAREQRPLSLLLLDVGTATGLRERVATLRAALPVAAAGCFHLEAGLLACLLPSVDDTEVAQLTERLRLADGSTLLRSAHATQAAGADAPLSLLELARQQLG